MIKQSDIPRVVELRRKIEDDERKVRDAERSIADANKRLDTARKEMAQILGSDWQDRARVIAESYAYGRDAGRQEKIIDARFNA